MLSIKDVQHIASLARLKLSQKEIKKFSRELSGIVAFVEKLDEVDAPRLIKLTKNSEAYLRKDEVEGCETKTRAQILSGAPEKEEDLIKVKSVFKN